MARDGGLCGQFVDREYFDVVETLPCVKMKEHKIAFAHFPFYQIWNSFSEYFCLLGLLSVK